MLWPPTGCTAASTRWSPKPSASWPPGPSQPPIHRPPPCLAAWRPLENHAILLLTCLVEHPASLAGFWQDRDPGLASDALAPAAPPVERMPMRIPVNGRVPHRLTDLIPGLEAAALERQRAQDLPPGFNQV